MENIKINNNNIKFFISKNEQAKEKVNKKKQQLLYLNKTQVKLKIKLLIRNIII